MAQGEPVGRNRAEIRKRWQKKYEDQFNRYYTDPEKRAEADLMQAASSDLGMSYYKLMRTQRGKQALSNFRQTYTPPGTAPSGLGALQVDPNTGVPAGEPSSPQYPGGGAPTGTGGGNPLVPGYPGFPVSAAPPGTSTSMLTPRQALPAFIPNYEAFFNPMSTMGSQPSYVDPRWFHRIEDPYSGPINQMPAAQPATPWQTGFSPKKGVISKIPSLGNMVMSGMSSPLMSGNTFGQFSPRGSIGGGMLGNMGKGITPVPIGGMLSRNYYG